MTSAKKPDFLKTFSEFTIDELRKMPLPQLFSLFFREVSLTFREGKSSRRSVKEKNVKKNETKPLHKKRGKRVLMPERITLPKFSFPTVSFQVPAVRLPFSGAAFSSAVKRIFTIGPVKNVKPERKKKSIEAVEETETVVFSHASGQGASQ